MNLRKIHAKLQAEFRAKKVKAERVANHYQNELMKISAYRTLVSLEKNLVFEIAKNKANKIACKDMEQSLAEVVSQKQALLKKLGVSKKQLTPAYECEVCKDVGFVGDKMCECYKKRRNEELLAECGINKDNMMTFDKFDTSKFKDKSQAETLEKIKTKLVDWAEKFPVVKKLNIVIQGTTGVGKTFLTECLASLLIEKGYSVCYLSAFELNSLMTKFHTTFDDSKQVIIAPLLHSDFLFVDDLGTEPVFKNITLNYTYLVISERERMKKPTIITTNLTPEQIMDRYEERIYSRLMNKNICAKFHISGDDLRKN